jgi:hypothetical protein
VYEPIIASFKDSDAAVMIVLFGGGILVAIVAIITEALRKTAQTKAREESRREIAAYVAEGSISADDAAKLLTSGGSIADKLKQKLGA